MEQRDISNQLREDLREVVDAGTRSGTIQGNRDIVEAVLPLLRSVGANAYERGRVEALDDQRGQTEWEQERRAYCLTQARTALANSGFLRSDVSDVDVGDLIRLALWIHDGDENLAAATSERWRTYVDERPRAWVDGRGMQVVEDTYLPEDPEGRDAPNYDPAEGDEGR